MSKYGCCFAAFIASLPKPVGLNRSLLGHGRNGLLIRSSKVSMEKWNGLWSGVPRDIHGLAQGLLSISSNNIDRDLIHTN